MLRKVTIRRDLRFTLQEDWEKNIIPNVEEAQKRGVLVTPLTVLGDNGVAGWFLHGWVDKPPRIVENIDGTGNYTLDYVI